MLDRHDREKIVDAQAAAKTSEALHQELQADFLQMASKIHSEKSKKKKKGEAAAAKEINMPHHIPTEAANLYNPPGSYLWHDNSRGGWCGHFAPYKRLSEPFTKHGGSSQESLKAVLRGLWIQYGHSKGQAAKYLCHVEGLFA